MVSEQFRAELRALSADEIRAEIRDAQLNIETLMDPPPSNAFREKVWWATLIFLMIATVVFAILTFIRLNSSDQSGSEIFTGAMTLCLGAIVGILAPSPS